MGTYTTLMKYGTKRWETRGYGGSAPQRTGSRAPIEKTQFICAECRQYFPYADDCPRCQQPLIDRTAAIPTYRSVSGTSSMSGSPAMYILGVLVPAAALAWIPAVEYTKSQVAGPILVIIFLFTAALIALPMGAMVTASLNRRWGFRRAVRAARKAALALTKMSPSELPDMANEPVRVAGRIQIDATTNEVFARVGDEWGTALLPVRGRIEARVADGSFTEVSALESGDEVEVIGIGRRAAATAGETYRACKSEFEFDADEPVQVWVTRSGRAAS
ncbi:MAG: hypothetical protein DRJ42_14310 [Deltaproteobacteria bacterium]|nr:MAG: hypothetical protein DRJ42_14310 [Deltaproteobacteria bacterium]